MRAVKAVAPGLATLASVLWLGCEAPPSVVVTVEDPAGAAAGADRLVIASPAHPSAPQTRSLEGRRFPLTFLYTGVGGSQVTLQVAALSGDRELAAGEALVQLPEDGAGAARVELRGRCAQDADCDDGLFCTGAERCERGLCAAGAPPCEVGRLACVVTTCEEAAAACAVAPDPGLDDGNPCTDDLCGPEGPRHVTSAEGALCLQDDLPNRLGVCTLGACRATRCGDGHVDPRAGEACDSGGVGLACVACSLQMSRVVSTPSGGLLDEPTVVSALSPSGRWLVVHTKANAEQRGFGPPRYGPAQSTSGYTALQIDLETRQVEHLGPVAVHAVADDGAALVVWRDGDTLRLVRVGGASGADVEVLSTPGSIEGAAMSADGARVVLRNRTQPHGPVVEALWWSAQGLLPLPELPVDVRLTITPDGRFASGPLTRVELDTGAVVRTPASGVRVSREAAVFIAPDGETVAFDGAGAGTALVSVAQVGLQVDSLARGYLWHAALSVDLVVGYDEAGALMLDVDSQARIDFARAPQGYPIVVTGARLPADGRFVVFSTVSDMPELGDDNGVSDVYVLPLP